MILYKSVVLRMVTWSYKFLQIIIINNLKPFEDFVA